jgi:hypothetical protein
LCRPLLLIVKNEVPGHAGLAAAEPDFFEPLWRKRKVQSYTIRPPLG